MHIKPWMAILLAVVALQSADGNASTTRLQRDGANGEDGNVPGWGCIECRDPAEHPEDFAAFAYNAYFGSDPWASSSRLGMPFRVYNMQMQWALIWFEDIVFDLPSLLPNTMDIRVRLPSGQVITITVIQGGPDLPVGPPVEPPNIGPDGSACTCGGGGGGEADDSGDAGDDGETGSEADDTGGQGVVDILDPDEDGEFPDWENEL